MRKKLDLLLLLLKGEKQYKTFNDPLKLNTCAVYSQLQTFQNQLFFFISKKEKKNLFLLFLSFHESKERRLFTFFFSVWQNEKRWYYTNIKQMYIKLKFIIILLFTKAYRKRTEVVRKIRNVCWMLCFFLNLETRTPLLI